MSLPLQGKEQGKRHFALQLIPDVPDVRRQVMDFRIRRAPEELEATGFMDIVPSKFSGKHWQVGSLFIWEDSFNVAEGIVAQHLPTFDHMAINEISRPVGAAIIAEWQSVGGRLPDLTADEAITELYLAGWFQEQFREEFDSSRAEMATLLRELSQECGQFYAQSEWITILGV